MMPEANDPTRLVVEPPASGPVLLSGNEVELLCLKAARGAGLSWGLAEEAGYAARWLYSRRIDGPGALLARLDGAPAAASPAAFRHGRLGGGAGGPLCPIATGAALSDFAALSPRRIITGSVTRPLLLLPFLHQLARDHACTMALDWRGGRIEVSPSGGIAGALTALAATEAAELTIGPAPGGQGGAPLRRAPGPTGGDTIARLNAYAMLTTAPASTASRTDAGAGLADND